MKEDNRNLSIFDFDSSIIPDEWKKQKESETSSVKNTSKSAMVKGISNNLNRSSHVSQTLKKNYVTLPVRVQYYTDEPITLGVADFDLKDIVYMTEEEAEAERNGAKVSTVVTESNKSNNVEDSSNINNAEQIEDSDIEDNFENSDNSDDTIILSAAPVSVDEMVIKNTAVSDNPSAEFFNAIVGQEKKCLPMVEIDVVREVLRRDYPALSKERTTMQYDKELNLVIPILTGGKNGARLSPFCHYTFDPVSTLSSGKALNIAACKDGLYKVVNTPFGIMSKKMDIVKELDNGFEGIKLKCPKIPFKTLQQIVSFFRDVSGCSSGDTYEAKLNVYLKEGEFIVIPPLQVSSYYSLIYKNPKGFSEKEMFLQIHSHGKYDAFFSGDDDTDDGFICISGVIGSVNMPMPSICTRAVLADTYLAIKPDSIFELPEGLKSIDNVTYPGDWLASVTRVGKDGAHV